MLNREILTVLVRKEWCLDDFDVGECLGTGRLGTVYSATELRTGKVVALKTVIKQEILDANVFRFLKREIEIQCRLWHPHILHLYAYFHDPKHVYIVLENAPGGSLHDLLRKSGAIAETTVAKYMTQMVDAVRFIHSLGVLHRDIKPENVLIGADGQLKLADFGWAVHDHRPRRRTFCGTLDYLAPEMIENKPHDKKVDIWALGVLCYELLVGSPPFEEPEPDSINKTYNRIIQLKYTFPSHIGMNAQHFVTRILQHDPPKRPQLDELERHPWLQAARNDQ
ncbi:kinase-like domain-containing protein [Fennellomyces sp. T-0311]|nr:kinase-like domain-containing protein [Fennellomyces sp. T-0311]